MSFHFSLTLNPFQYELLVGSGEEMPSPVDTDLQTAIKASINDLEQASKDKEIARDQYEQFCQSDSSVSSLHQEKEVIVIDAEEDLRPKIENLLKKYTDDTVGELKAAIADLAELRNDQEIYQVISESLTLSESSLNPELHFLFTSLMEKVLISLEMSNEKDDPDLVKVAVKQALMQKIHSYAAEIETISPKYLSDIVRKSTVIK